MCGIVGFTGRTDCVKVLLSGLESLEYRGYDSAGVAVLGQDGLQVRKAAGRLANLRAELTQNPVGGCTGIGHTRWATHGEPNEVNAHPHTDMSGRVAVVHNGIIENFAELKSQLTDQGVKFRSQTDTEVVAQLLGLCDRGDMRATLRQVLPMLRGSYALVIASASQPDTLWCVRCNNPLVIGRGEGANYIASDVAALLRYTREVYLPDDYEVAEITADRISFFAPDGSPIEKEIQQVGWDVDSAQKKGFDHFMLKEIFEQPRAIADTLRHYVDTDTLTLRRDRMPFTRKQAVLLRQLTIVACGTAYHAGMMGKSLIQRLARIPVQAEIASEYRYSETLATENEVVIAVSQSGETADTVAAVRKAKKNGQRVISLCNVIGSTIARETDAVLYTLAGPEIAVASTKAYSTQMLLFELIALDLANLRGELSDEELREHLAELLRIPEKMEQILAQKDMVKEFTHRMKDCEDVFFIGRLMDYYSSLEAALKLKEISYLHSEAYAAGELKHGTIAMIDDTTLVVAIATQESVLEKTMSNVEEVRARGARLLLLSDHEIAVPAKAEVWAVPQTFDAFAPILTIVYLQLFAYYMALQRGCDIDKPRNLAKSVTVE